MTLMYKCDNLYLIYTTNSRNEFYQAIKNFKVLLIKHWKNNGNAEENSRKNAAINKSRYEWLIHFI